MMGHIQATRQLWMTPEEAWAVVTDLRNWDQWFTLHQSWVKEPPATLKPGTTMVSKIAVLGVPTTMNWQVSVANSGSRLVVIGNGAAGVRCRFEISITPTRDGSEITMAGTFRGELIQGLVGDALENDLNRQLSSALRRMDALYTPHVLAATA